MADWRLGKQLSHTQAFQAGFLCYHFLPFLPVFESSFSMSKKGSQLLCTAPKNFLLMQVRLYKLDIFWSFSHLKNFFYNSYWRLFKKILQFQWSQSASQLRMRSMQARMSSPRAGAGTRGERRTRRRARRRGSPKFCVTSTSQWRTKSIPHGKCLAPI